MNAINNRQSGAVLLVAMVFLLLTTIIATTLMKTSVLEMRMAANEQYREEAFQNVQGLLTAIVSDDNNMPVFGGVGYTICRSGGASAECDESIITPPAAVTAVPTGVVLDYQAQRRSPEFTQAPPWRQTEDNVSGSGTFAYATFEVEASYSGSSVGLSNSSAAQGVVIRVATGGQ